MLRAKPMQISLGALLGWVLPAGVLVGAAGAYPTWCLGGRRAVEAMLWAGGIVFGIVLLSALAVVGSAPAGAGRATLAFVAAGLGRLILAPALGAWVVWEFRVPPGAMFVWLAAFYVVLLMAESAWLSRALRRDAHRVSPGEGVRPASTDATGTVPGEGLSC
jgi:hypothetical protein